MDVLCRLFSEKGEKLKTLDFMTGAGTYTVNTKKGSYSISGDRMETLGTNMYVMFLLASLAQSCNDIEQCMCICMVEYLRMYADVFCNFYCAMLCTMAIHYVAIKPTLLSHRHPQQSGFTPGHSTCDHIATLCSIAQRRQDFSHPTFAAFVDLRAAFDCLSRPALWLLLTRLGIPDKIVRLFRVLYDNSVSCVRTGGTRSFKIEAGVRQGCVLAPDLFATGMDWLLDRTVESC